MLGNIEAYLACCQLGITMASLGLGWVGEPTVSALLEPVLIPLGMSERTLHFMSFLVGFLVFSSLHIVIGEQVPKTLADPRAEPVSLWIAYPLHVSYLLLLSAELAAQQRLTRRFCACSASRKPRSRKSSPTAEIEGLVDVSAEHGEIESGEAEYIHNVFRFGELDVSDVMVHRTAMVLINADLPPDELVDEVLATAYTRMPLWRDKPENIIGILHAKDLLRAIRAADGDTSRINVAAIMLPPWFVPDTRPLSEQLKAFRSRKTHFALVVDEYGEVEGLVTLEDILEEIVGDISDEHDVVVAGVRAAARRLRHGRRLGADPRPQPRHELAAAGRGGDDHRRPRHPRGALDPRARARASPSTASASACCARAQPHHGAQDRAGAARRRGRGSEAEAGGDGVLSVRLTLFDIDADAAELPLAVGGDEAELVLHLFGRRVEMTLQAQHAFVVDLRVFIRNDRACDDRVEHGVLLDQVLEDGPQLVGRKLIAERL